MKWQRKYVAVYVLRKTGKQFKNVKTGPKFPIPPVAVCIARHNTWKRYMFPTRFVVRFLFAVITIIIYRNSIGRLAYYIQEPQCMLWSVKSCVKCLYVSFVLCRIKSWFIRLESNQFCVFDSSPWHKNLGHVCSIRSGEFARFVWSISTNGKSTLTVKRVFHCIL